MRLYHTGNSEIRRPDLAIGRSNADFGQGFYLCSDESFAGNWARERVSQTIYVNTYELELDGLRVKRFARDEEWYDHITGNRAGRTGSGSDYDVVIGPIANDTLFDTYGMITSGMLTKAQALELLTIGPSYEQIVIRTQRAADALTWLSSRVISAEELERARTGHKAAAEEYNAAFTAAISEMLDLEE